MKYLKTFESIFDLWKSPLKDRLFNSDEKEIRISVDEPMFRHLCKTGHIVYQGVQIPVEYDDFVQFMGGSIIDIKHQGKKYKLALQDIGLNRILQIVKNSPFYS